MGTKDKANETLQTIKEGGSQTLSAEGGQGGSFSLTTTQASGSGQSASSGSGTTQDTAGTHSLFGGFTLSTSDSGLSWPSRFGFGTGGYDPEEMIRTLSKIGVRPPRPFNPKKDKNFDNWLSRIEYHFALMGLSDDRCTAALLLQLDPDAQEIA